MAYMIHTGNKGVVGTTVRSGGYGSPPLTIVFDHSLEDNEWAIHDEDGMVKGPLRFTQDYPNNIREKLKELGVVPTSAPAQTPRVDISARRPKAAPPVTLDTCTQAILGLQRKTIRNYAEIGRWLIEAKTLIGHGNWLEYLATVKLAEWIAQGCMRMYRELGAKPRTFEDLTFSEVLLILDAPKEARPELIEVARTQPVRVLRQRVRLVRRSVAPQPPVMEAKAPAPLSPVVPPPSPPEPAPDPEPEPSPFEPQPAPPTPPEPTPLPEDTAPPEAAPVTPAQQEPTPPPRGPEPAPPLPVVAPSEPDPYQEHKEKALAVNMAIRAFLDTAASNRSPIDTAQGKEFGDWIDLKALYEADKTLEEVQDALRRLAADCYRPC